MEEHHDDDEASIAYVHTNLGARSPLDRPLNPMHRSVSPAPPPQNRLACSRLLGAREIKPDMAEGMLPAWLRAVALVTEPDVLARLLSLLQNWADPHRGRPRVLVDMWTDREHGPLHAAVLMGCVNC